MKGNREKTARKKVKPSREQPNHDGPVRTCSVSRTRHPQEHLLRFVKSPEGLWVEDVAGRLPGHGLYVLPTMDRIGRLLKKNGDTANLDGVVQRCGIALSRRFLDGLGLAKRAGVVRRGLREAEALLQAGHKPLLILAANIATHSRQKFEGVVHRYAVDEWVELLDSVRLGAACGWSESVVLAVNDPGLERRLRVDAFRWQTFHRKVDA